MAYSYDRRTAADKKWHDIQQDAETAYMDKTLKELAKLLKGKATPGGFASGTITYPGGTVTMGFMGGGGGMVYVTLPSGKRTEHSVVNHTPITFAQLLANRELV